MKRRHAIACMLTVAITAGVNGCAGSPSMPDSDPGGQPDEGEDKASKKMSGALAGRMQGNGDHHGVSAPRAISASTLDEIQGSIISLRRVYADLQGNCMAVAGFPQLLQSRRIDQPAIESAPGTNPLAFEAAAYAPITQNQARQLGILGVAQLFLQTSGVGNVMHNDPAFDIALESCDATLVEKSPTDPTVWMDIQGLAGEFAALQRQLALELIVIMDSEEGIAYQQRWECIRDSGYPEHEPETVDDALRDGGMDLVFKLIGIEPGTWQLPSFTAGEAPLEPGEVRVIPPSPPPTYIPSPSEVEYALTQVACDRETGFLERVREAHDEAAKQLLDEHGLTILGFGETSQELRDRVGALGHNPSGLS